MEIRPRIVRTYITPDGREPFEEWLDSLKDKTTESKVHDRLLRLRRGNFGDCKHLRGGLYELRIHYGAGYRVYFGDVDGEMMMLLWGGSKRTQQRDIQRARDYWEEFRSREHE